MSQLPHPGSSCSEDEDEITPHEYARNNGIAYDYLNDPSAFLHLGVLQKQIETGLTDDSHLVRFDFGEELRIEERLMVSKEAAQLLASASHIESPEVISSIVFSVLDSRRTKKLRVELPLLKSHHETDCEDFAQREGFEIKLKDVKLPIEMVDDENNEGITFPARFWNLTEKTLEDLKKERLMVTKDTLAYLSQTLKYPWSSEDENELWKAEQMYKKNTALEPVTPPLSIIYPLPQHYEPALSSPGFQLPILSDPASLTTEDLQTIEKKLFEQDLPTPIRNVLATNNVEDSSSDKALGDEVARLGDIYSPLASLDNDEFPPLVEVQRFRREYLKVEVPLTPPRPTMASAKSVRFNHIIEELDVEPASPSQKPDVFESKFFEEAFGDAYQKATQKSEQEKLIEADATARVDIPTMDFSKPEPSWNSFQRVQTPASLLLIQKSFIKATVGSLLQLWPGAKQGHHKLDWQPFPRDLSKVALEENFDQSDSTWEIFVNYSRTDDVIDSSSLVWKPTGLRILNDEDDEDEIELGQFLKDQPKDMSYLAKKRKMIIEGENGFKGQHSELKGHTSSNNLDAGADASTKQIAWRSSPNHHTPTEANIQLDSPRSQGFGSLLEGTFSAENSLNNFLEIRGAKKPKLADAYLCSKVSESQAQPSSRQTLERKGLQLPILKSPISKAEPLPVPPTETTNTPIHIIVSSLMLRNRPLIKHLEKNLPGLNIIERDFSAHNTTIWMPNSVSRSPIASPLSSEADFILSPTTGLILTTLQKIKQRPLPGHKAKAVFRERLEKVAPRYAKLVVLISESHNDETTKGLDATDCVAVAEFAGFSTGLDCVVTVHFVGGGAETLGQWVMSEILRYRVDEDLLVDETHWELFLRRAGMNAFAAQAVIAGLKAPDGVNPRSATKVGLFGLTSFVEMSRDQRMQRFGHLCGRKVLQRVSAVVDAVWE